MGEGDREGGVCGEVELGVAFAPVSGVWVLVIVCGCGCGCGGGGGGIRRDLLDDGNIDGGSSARRVDLGVGHCRDIIITTKDERGDSVLE